MIEAQALSKNYGTFQAVNDVSFTADFPGAVGLLGPNGAGKTTILKMLAGSHAPSGGRVKIDGHSLEENGREIRERIGYLPENNPLYLDMSPLEYLNFIAEAHLLTKEKKKKAVTYAIETCGLGSSAGKKIEILSKGFRQRTGLAAAIIHDPSVLILDEPTSGLDPNQIIEIRSLIKRLAEKKTLVLSTHILSEAEALCSKLVVINEGRVAVSGHTASIAEAAGESGTWELTVKGGGEEKIRASLKCLNVTLFSAASVSSALGENEGSAKNALKLKLAFTEKSKEKFPARKPDKIDAEAKTEAEIIFDWAMSQNLKILEMNKTHSSLEEIFAKLTNGASAGKGPQEK